MGGRIHMLFGNAVCPFSQEARRLSITPFRVQIPPPRSSTFSASPLPPVRCPVGLAPAAATPGPARDMRTLTRALAGCCLLARLDGRLLQRLALVMRPRRVPAGAMLLRPGEEEEGGWVLVEGTCTEFVQDPAS